MAADPVTTFRRDGYLLVPGLLDAAGVERVTRAVEAAAELVPADNPLSLDTMRFASNLYRESPVLRELLASDAVLDVVRSVASPPGWWVRWDQAVWKGAGAPVFPWHQDNGYTGLDAEHLQLWVALTPMTPANGGLLLSPGAHRSPRAHRWEGDHATIDAPDDSVAVSADAGDAVLFSSWLPHATTRNETGAARLAYVAELLALDVPDRSVAAPHLVVADASGGPVPRWDDLTMRWSTVVT